MKTQTLKLCVALLALFAALNVAYGNPQSSNAVLPPPHVYIEVKGLACPFCVQGLEKHLKKLDAVEGVTTSLKKGEAVLHLKAGKTVSEKELREAVKKAGFTAGEIRFEKQPGAAPAGNPTQGEKE